MIGWRKGRKEGKDRERPRNRGKDQTSVGEIYYISVFLWVMVRFCPSSPPLTPWLIKWGESIFSYLLLFGALEEEEGKFLLLFFVGFCGHSFSHLSAVAKWKSESGLRLVKDYNLWDLLR